MGDKIILINKGGVITVTPPSINTMGWFSIKVLEGNEVHIDLSAFKERIEELEELVADTLDTIRNLCNMRFGDVPNKDALEGYCKNIEAAQKALKEKDNGRD